MTNFCSALRSFCRFPFALAICFVSSFAAVQAADVVLVEEQWVLEVATTDSNSTAPQVATAISPTGDVDGTHFVFELNHQSVPDFEPGGLHLQVWDGEEPTDTRKFPDPEVMSSGHEVVTWTTRTWLDGTVLSAAVANGSSESWGSFGGQGYLKSSLQTSLSNLNGYDPAVSVKNSGVTYAGNRVTKLVLKRVKLVKSDGQVILDETPRVVHEN